MELQSGPLVSPAPVDGWRDRRHAHQRSSSRPLGSDLDHAGLGEWCNCRGSAGETPKRMEDSLMIRLREELAVIPRAMWVITILVYVGLAALVVFVVGAEMPMAVRLIFGLGLPLIFSSVLLL